MFNKAKRYTLVSIGIWLLLMLGSLVWNISQINSNQLATYLENARSLFSLIVTTREWNSLSGGVYLPVTEQVQPNPYLIDPKRDITSTDGLQLTKINPAYMTRLIAELAEKKENIKFHITSLNPIRPANQAADWEIGALTSFEKDGRVEYYAYDSSDKGVTFRYMARLVTQESCLMCHAAQGYKLGEIRGGISVSFPVTASSPWAIIFTHFFLAVGVSGLIWVYGKQLERTVQILEIHSHIDGLTEVHNRRYFDEALTREYLHSKRYKVATSFALCDIDDFKSFNDTYGHVAGDECLKKIAQALNNALNRPGDLVARYGGEEFGIILPYTSAAGALALANMLRAQVEALQIVHRASKVTGFVTISIGVATYFGDEVGRNELLKMADEALYRAKASGKNFVLAHNAAGARDDDV